MSMKASSIVYCILVALLLTGLLAGCKGAEPLPVTPPEKPVEAPATPQGNTPSETPLQGPENKVDKVEVVYFHQPQRCKKCICFEERVTYVIDTYFQEEIKNGKMSFQVIDLSDAQEAAVIRKYNAIASQLFIDTIIDGNDHIRDIQEIWPWDCTTDPEGFDEAIRYLITLSLKGELE
jgi:hypothetical protein